MKSRFLISLVILFALVGLFPSTVYADGIIIPQPPICGPASSESGVTPPRPPCPPPPQPVPIEQLAIKYHHVTVKVQDQIAVTHVDQVFFNPNDWTIEGDYIFPLPLDAAVSSFTLWVDGKPVKGEVLDAAQAREKYEEIVRAQRDPALLEYADRGAVQAHIFPIPAQGERRIELEYSQALTAENGLVRYVYPLNTEKFSTEPLEDVSVSVEIDSSQPIRAVYSPTHDVSIDRPDDRHATAGYEAKNVKPDSDFALYYSIGESEAFHLLTYRDPSDPTDPDGFFLVLMAPKPEEQAQPLPKDVLLVLDRSGSMDGDKFRQAQDALRFVLRHLNPQDRFDVITFSTGLDSYASSLRPADEAPEAIAWVDGQNAQGSTDINRALLEAAGLADPERPTYLIFLTDGLPTEGVTDSQEILKNFARTAKSNLRLFAFGVGYDVDTVLLDTLAQEHHGASTYVRPGDALDEMLSSFYAKISTPVLTDLKLDFGGLSVSDVYPSPLPDLFLGSQIVAVGRYRAGETVTVTLTGSVQGSTQTFRYPEQVFTDADMQLAALPRLWATRKIGFLLNKIRLEGTDKETVDQIVRLSIRYGIVTPYTSYLVTEELPLGADAQSHIIQNEYSRMLAMPTQPASGQAAVDKATGQGALQSAQAPAAAPVEDQSTIRIVGARTFVLSNGIWTDTGYDPKAMQPIRVAFLSDDYFALAKARPDLAAALALGEQVIVLVDGKAYEVVPAGEAVPPVQIPATATAVRPAATPLPQTGKTVQPEASSTSTPVSGASTPIDPATAIPIALGVIIPVTLIVLLGRKRL